MGLWTFYPIFGKFKIRSSLPPSRSTLTRMFFYENSFRQGLSAPGMYSLIHRQSQKIPDKRQASSRTILLSDAVMSATALFSMKYPSCSSFVRLPVIKSPRITYETYFMWVGLRVTHLCERYWTLFRQKSLKSFLVPFFPLPNVAKF